MSIKCTLHISLVDTILVVACLGAGRQGYCELGTGEYGSILVLYKLHVMDTFVCGSFFLSCFYDNLYNMVIMNNYSYDTFLYYNAIIFYSTNII